jgi:tagatose 6-phosphate kinase
MASMTTVAPVRRLVGVSLNAAIDKIAAVDRLAAGGIHRPDLLSALPGGKAINAVRAAHRLGLAAEVVAVVAGHAGSWLVDALDTRGIPGRYVRVDGETRTCLSVLDRSTGALTEFYEAGLTLPDDRWPVVEAELASAVATDPAGTVVLLAGSLPPGAPRDAYARLVARSQDAGARAIVDIGGEPLLAALGARPWLVKVNAAEAASVVGDTPTPIAMAERLRDLGAGAALVTMGVDGAVVATDDGAWRVGPPAALGPYSVGSGDAFAAGLLVGLARGGGIVSALRLAAGAAAANALIPGQGELDPTDVERIAAGTDVMPA